MRQEFTIALRLLLPVSVAIDCLVWGGLYEAVRAIYKVTRVEHISLLSASSRRVSYVRRISLTSLSFEVGNLLFQKIVCICRHED